MVVWCGSLLAIEAPRVEENVSENNAVDEKIAAIDNQIKQLKAKIKTLNQQVTQNEQLKTAQLNRLSDLETQIKKQNLALANLQLDITKHETTLQTLKDSEREINAALASQQKTLAKQLKMAYLLSQTTPLKILLSQQSPHTLDRLLRYHQILKTHSSQIINKHFDCLHDLQLTKNKIEEEHHTLAALKQSQENQMTELKTLHSLEEEFLKGIQKEIDAHQKHLAGAKQAEQDLESQLTAILVKMTDLPPALPTGLSFEQAKGQLQWPIKDKRPSTSLFNPFMIKATVGQEVRAIYHGRVVFSEWLRGFGLLLIIDHGGGYMSLYGNNQTLYKNVGESVNAGQLIAQVGPVSGSSNSGLYFEIRKNGRSIRSTGWFK